MKASINKCALASMACLVIAGTWSGWRLSLRAVAEIQDNKAAGLEDSRQINPNTLLERQPAGMRFLVTREPANNMLPRGGSLIDAPVQDRQAFRDSLDAMPPEQVFQIWLEEPVRGGDRFRMELAAIGLGAQLSKPENRESTLIGRLAELAADATQSDIVRWDAARILSRAASPKAAAALLSLMQRGADEIARMAASQLLQLSDHTSSDADLAGISALIESSLLASGELAPAAREAMAVSLIKIGQASGLRLVMERLARFGATVADFENQDHETGWLLYDCLTELRNESLIPALNEYLAGQPISRTQAVAAGHALSSMGNPRATEALMIWMRATQQDVAPHIEAWLSRIRDLESIEIADQMARQTFAHEGNRNAVIETLRRWHSDRSMVGATE